MYDHGNNIVHQVFAGTLAANTTYNDTLNLPPGCYRFTLYDSGGDGLSFWANPGQGSGYARFLKNGGGVYKTFIPDFGSETGLNFRVAPGALVSVQGPEAQKARARLYPNPSGAERVAVTVLDVLGRTVFSGAYDVPANEMIGLDLTGQASGIYHVRLHSGSLDYAGKVVIQR
jgi:hypothetical protein